MSDREKIFCHICVSVLSCHCHISHILGWVMCCGCVASRRVSNSVAVAVVQDLEISSTFSFSCYFFFFSIFLFCFSMKFLIDNMVYGEEEKTSHKYKHTRMWQIKIICFTFIGVFMQFSSLNQKSILNTQQNEISHRGLV